MNLILKTVCFCFFVLSLNFMVFANNQSNSLTFLSLTPDARSNGMGGAGIAFSPGAFSIFHLPAATLFSEKQAEFGYTFAPWMRAFMTGSTLNSFGEYYNIDGKQSIAIGFRHFTHFEIPFSNGSDPVENFRPNEFSIDLAYARLIRHDLSLSGTFRYIHSNMGDEDGAKVGKSVAFDIGAMYKGSLSIVDHAEWKLGLQVANFGTNLSYVKGKKEHLPNFIKVGSSVYMPFTSRHKVEFGLDFNYLFAPSETTNYSVSCGAEYSCGKYAIFRSGYHIGEQKKGYESYATVGAGLRFGQFTSDFSYWITPSDSFYKNTCRFSLGFIL